MFSKNLSGQIILGLVCDYKDILYSLSNPKILQISHDALWRHLMAVVSFHSPGSLLKLYWYTTVCKVLCRISDFGFSFKITDLAK
jgi:hypothetical protein